MVARFSECVVVSNWLPHTPVQIFFRLVLVHKTVWCSLSSSSIQTGVLARTFHITLIRKQFEKIFTLGCIVGILFEILKTLQLFQYFSEFNENFFV